MNRTLKGCQNPVFCNPSTFNFAPPYLRERYSDGLKPTQRLNAREKINALV